MAMGVNVAVRLQEIAEPGDVCISSNVHDQLQGKLVVGFESLGEKKIKNLVRPIHVYRIESGQVRPVEGKSRRLLGARLPQIPAVASVALALLVTAGLITWNFCSPGTRDQGERRLTGRPGPSASH